MSGTTRKGLRSGLFLLAGAAVLLLGATQLGRDDANPPPLNTVLVERGDVSRRVVAHGTLEPVHTVTVGSQVSGIVESVHVDFNSPVTRSQIIAQIDPSTFRAAVRSAEAEVGAAEADLELARLEWERLQALRENQFVSASEFDEATAALRRAETRLTVQRNALERAERELDRSTIRSPADGIVISRNVDQGQTVAASFSSPNLFEIASDLSTMHIHAYVSEADIGSVAEGQSVTFVVDAHRGRDFSGEVIQVRNAPIVESNVVHYETIVGVENTEGLLKPGMTAEASIVTDEVSDVVRVRNTALRARLPDALIPPEPENPARSDGRVFRLEAGDIVAVAVETGLSDELYTQIRDGVAPGDTLVVGLALRTEEDRDGGLISGSQAQY